MTTPSKINADWASIKVTDRGNAIVCAKSTGTSICLCFDGLTDLKDAIETRNVAVRKWAISVSDRNCILKHLTLPAADMNEAARMMEFELSSLVPIPPEKLVYGCTLLSKQDNMLNLLVCIVPLVTLDRLLEPYKSIGIQAARVTPDFLSVQSWFNIASNKNGGLSANILLDKHTCHIGLSEDGYFHTMSEMNLNGSSIEQITEKIIQEIHCGRENVTSQTDGIHIRLVGTEEYASQLQNTLQKRLDGTSPTLLTPPDILYCNNSSSKETACNLVYDIVVASGLIESIAAPELHHANMLPRQLLKKTQQEARLLNYLTTVGLSIVLIFLIWLSLAGLNWRVERLSMKIQAQITPIEHLAGSVESKRQRLKAIERQLTNRGQISQIFAELGKYTPNGISISELKFTREPDGMAIDIKGQADSLSNAFEYPNSMSKAVLLKDIQVANVQQIPRAGGSIVELKAGCVLRNK
jgi:hypothetical protein